MADGHLVTSLQLVTFRDVLENVVQEAHAGLQQLAEKLPALGDEDRKRQLLQHLQTTRQRLQRLHVCAQWAHKAKAVNTCREVLKAATDHGAAFVHAADEFFRLSEELRFTRAPLFDVSTALHIMQTGTYRLLPSIIEEELQQPGQRLERPGEQGAAQQGERQAAALRRVDFLLRSKLLASELPVGMRVLRVRGGAATVAAAGGQYTARLTLVPSPRDDVISAKYRPPGEAKEGPSLKEEPEVMQPAPGGSAAPAAAADDQPSSSAAAAGRAPAADSTGGLAAGSQPRQGTDCWRWQLLSLELLPSAAGQDPPPLLQQQRQWLQQHIEQRMWAAGDVEQLLRMGKQAWVTVPSPLTSASAKEQQAGRGSSAPFLSGPAPSGSLLATNHLTAAAVAADSKGKQKVKEEPGLEQPLPSEQQQQQQQQQQAEEPSHGLPRFATSPLAAMHAILCQAAGRLALFSLLLWDAKRLEGGSWGGSLKLSRAATGSGIRLAYWQQLPCPSYEELLCLREGSPYQPAAAAGAAASAGEQQAAPVVEVSLREDGSLAASSSPQLHHPLTAEAVHLALPLDAASSFDADRLLLQAAASSAAVQLAAVQAVLHRSGRLAPAGIHAELLVTASSAASAAGGALPTSPLLQLWAGGSLQLTLSLQLRSGRLLLAAGPPLLESEQGSSTAAAVTAAQLQLDQLQRDAMTQPLPAGSSRGMQGANLVADAVARLSLQISMQQRMDAAAAAAAACGLRRAALPPRLLQQHLRQAMLLEPLSANMLTLALPAFPPPGDLQQWARQPRGAGSVGGAASTFDCGATRCFMLLDFVDSPAAAPGNAGSTAQQQQRRQQLRIMLAVCSCTSRGTVTRVLQLAELPAEALQQAAATAGAPASSATAASRKRRACDAAAGEAAPEPAAAGAATAAGSLEASLEAAAAWCRRQGSWAALRAQLALLSVRHAEELSLGTPQQRVLRLPNMPALAQLEPWAVAQLAGGAAAAQPAPTPGATMQLEEEAGEEGVVAAGGAGGKWRVDLTSQYFSHLQRLLEAQGIQLAPAGADAGHMGMQASGLTLRYSLQKGDSMLAVISDLVRLSKLHLCLTRLAGKMAANPLAAGARAAAAADGKCSQAAGPANGDTANGQLPQKGRAAPAAALVWPLPGCGSVRLPEASLAHILLEVAPPPLPLSPEAQAGGEQPQPLRLTVRWGNTLLDSPRLAGQAAAQQQQQQQQEAASSRRGSLSHIRCCISSEPPLPEPVAAALGQQLEAGREDLFLDSLCLAAHSAAALAGQLSREGQRAAGLLPGAFQLLRGSTSASTSTSGGPPSSALRLRAQLQQGERAATLALGFHACGYTLVQLQPPPHGSAAASAAAWMSALWQRLGQQIPSFSAVDPAAPLVAAPNGQQPPDQQQQRAPQLHQAWVHRDGLAAAVAAVMQAVAAGAQPDSQ